MSKVWFITGGSRGLGAEIARAAIDSGDDVVATARARLLGDADAVLAPVEALDLPDVRLDAGVLQLAHGPDDELGPQLGVVARAAAADPRELRRLGRHEQLEQEPATAAAQPVREPA